jgi:hypothetical protein
LESDLEREIDEDVVGSNGALDDDLEMDGDFVDDLDSEIDLEDDRDLETVRVNDGDFVFEPSHHTATASFINITENTATISVTHEKEFVFS